MNQYLNQYSKLGEVLDAVRNDCTPEQNLIFRSFMPVEQIRVVILGQDPYPQPGVATGLAFEVSGLNSWKQSFRQVSLKNLVRLLYASYRPVDPYEISYRGVVEEMDEGNFSLLPPNRLFEYWKESGVLLLNTALTCSPGYPGSHAEIWKNFSDGLIRYIEESVHPIWFLWGKSAQNYGFVRNKFCSRHPMLCSSSWEDDFLKNPCFRRTKDLVDWLG